MACNDCPQDPNLPQVDNTSLACEELISTNCIVSAETDVYLGVAAGKTMTFALTKISNSINSIDQLLASKVPYTNYTAVLTQTGITDPTAVSLANTLGSVPTITYTSQGVYTITSAGLFTAGKTVVTPPQPVKQFTGTNEDFTNEFTATWVDVNTITLTSSQKVAGVGTLTDGLLDGINTVLDIKIYP